MQEKDHWSPDAYQKAAGFVPKLAAKVVDWLDVQPSDSILDVGCGDGTLTCHFAQALTTGFVFGIDSSNSMIESAVKLKEQSYPSINCNFYPYDAKDLLYLQKEGRAMIFDKVFSNAALHWILRDGSSRGEVFNGIHSALRSGGVFVFEMGGVGNVQEMRAALLDAVTERVGAEAAQKCDPWFFPDEEWMRVALERYGFVVEKMELEQRPTKVEEGEGKGIAGWLRLMASQFFDAVGEDGTAAREDCIREVVERLEKDCRGPDGGHVIGYVRLRAMARKLK